MSNIRRIEYGLRIGLVTSLLTGSCAAPNNFSETEIEANRKAATTQRFEDLDSGVGSFDVVTAEPVLTISPTKTEVPQIIWSTPEALTNPFAGHVFNQRCQIIATESGQWRFSCTEKWAESPLPGGCPNPVINYLGSSTCNSAATAFVINKLAPANIISKVIGLPGIDPKVLVYGVYENLPKGEGFKMSCNGAGENKVQPALELFGLKVEPIKDVSWWSLPTLVESLRSDQLIMISMIGTNAKGRRFQHFSVAHEVVSDKYGRKHVLFYDSFFYKDPKNPNPEEVDFADSPNIQDDPSNPIGKRVDIVGATIISRGDFANVQKLIDAKLIFRDQMSGVDFESSYVVGRNEYVVTERGLDESSLNFLGNPIQVGTNRYRITIVYQGRQSEYYYFDESGGKVLPNLNVLYWYKWNNFLIPLFKQSDPEWAGRVIEKPSQDGSTYQFGRRGCGESVASSILSMTSTGNTADFIDPFEVYQKYFPELEGGRGTFPKDYKFIFDSLGLITENLPLNKESIEVAASEGKLVMVQGAVNFKLNVADGSVVNHYVLVLGYGSDGRLQIFDPVWGVGVTELDDIDLTKSAGIIAVSIR